MKTSLWHRWCNSLRYPKPTRPISRARLQRRLLGLQVLEDRITPTLTPQMVLDISPGSSSSNSLEKVAIGTKAYFDADDGIHGYELWKSDGTASGTTLVSDINPGSGHGGPGNLTDVNGTLFFTAGNAANVVQLWKSDGTEAGTLPVSLPGLYAYNLTNVNGTLFFASIDSNQERELWKSDGTTAGTTMVKDIFPGTHREYDDYGNWWYAPNSSCPRNLTNVNGKLFFTADDGADGRELWKSDGTAAGTVLVKDIGAGSSIRYLTNSKCANGSLFFVATDGTTGYELWKSDGTATGTVLVKDISPLGLSSYPSYLADVNGTLFFTAYDGTTGYTKLWKTDGTANGTVLVKDINPGSGSSSPSNLTTANGTLYFSAYTNAGGWVLWKSDGTPDGTVVVKVLDSYSVGSAPTALTSVNETLFFSANDGTGERKLWQSDGTAAGTVLVANLIPRSLTNVNGTLFFSANDGIHGDELWKLGNDAPIVIAVTIGDGTVQRSQVTQLSVSFSTQVAFAGAVGSAFTLTRTSGGAVSFTAAASVVGGVTVVTLNAFTGGETELGSLADGRYTLTAIASQISANGQQLDGNGNGTGGDNYTLGDAQGLFRMFGDVNGDRVVNGLDFGYFKNAFGTQAGDPNYLSYLDFNGDGIINGFDFGHFRARFGTILP